MDAHARMQTGFEVELEQLGEVADVEVARVWSAHGQVGGGGGDDGGGRGDDGGSGGYGMLELPELTGGIIGNATASALRDVGGSALLFSPECPVPLSQRHQLTTRRPFQTRARIVTCTPLAPQLLPLNWCRLRSNAPVPDPIADGCRLTCGFASC
jgi:hypothetical protein